MLKIRVKNMMVLDNPGFLIGSCDDLVPLVVASVGWQQPSEEEAGDP